MSEQFGICSDTIVATPPECPGLMGQSGSSSFLDPTDHCGCNGLTCPANQACRLSVVHCSCNPQRHNICVEQPCSSDADCGDDVCVPEPLLFGKRCITPKCRGDADCEPGTACVAVVALPDQAGDSSFVGVECFPVAGVAP